MKRPFWARALGGRPGPFRLVLALVLTLVVLALPASRAPGDLDTALDRVAGGQAFGLWGWEVDTLTARWSQALFRPPTAAGPALVRRYGQLSAADARVRVRRDQQWAKQDVTGSAPGLAATETLLAADDAALARLRPAVEATISQEIESQLRADAIREGFLTWNRLPTFPFARPEVTPGVFFQLGPLPNLLVVAPRDRVAIIDSVLLQSSLTPSQIDSLETRTDGLGVSSVVTGIGGLAAYPTMLPDTGSTHGLLLTVAHEWTHHYLALRPLGMHYFDSYQMREINETVADMVGAEVGGAVYERWYAASAPPPPAPSAPAGPPRKDFGTLMREIRVTVEADLARHDVAGADAYMAEQRQQLAKQGYYVRRLNTAYLAFFGSYAGSANSVEPKLRRVRQRSGSLAAFLETVSRIETPSDLDRLASRMTR